MSKATDVLAELGQILTSDKPQVEGKVKPNTSVLAEACAKSISQIDKIAEHLDAMSKMMHDLKLDLQTLQEACSK